MRSLYLLLLLVALVPHSHGSETCHPLFYPEACHRAGGASDIVFERHSFAANPRNEVATYVRGRSVDSVLIHVLFVFGDHTHHYHNALLVNPRSLEKLRPIMRESEFPFNNELLLVTKGQELVVQFDVAGPLDTHFDGIVGHYDAVLSLDYYASLWNEYNTVVVERSRLTLRMTNGGGREDDDDDATDFSGMYELRCNRSHSVKRCHVILPSHYIGQLPVNGRLYNTSGIIIDASRTDNLLPYDLYVRWKYHDERNLFIGGDDDDDPILLHLNSQFEFEINHESLDVVLGIDFMLHFQKVAYCLETGHYRAWYYDHLYSHHERHLLHGIVMCLFVTTLLTIFFYWVISPNYNAPDVLLRGESALRFPYNIVLSEMVAYAIGAVVVVLSLAFVAPIDATQFSPHKQRALLFTVALLYHLLLGLFYLAWRDRKLTRHAVQYYRRYTRYLTRGDAPDGPLAYSLTATPGHHAKLSHILVRNLTLNACVATTLLLIFNFLAIDRPLYLLVCLAISVLATYYYVKPLLVILLYLAREPHRALAALTLLSSALFVVYAVLLVPLLCVPALQEFNGMYSEVFLWLLAVSLLFMVGAFATGIVFIITVWHRPTTVRDTPSR